MQKLPFSISTLTEKSTNYTYLITKYFPNIPHDCAHCTALGSIDQVQFKTVRACRALSKQSAVASGQQQVDPTSLLV